MTPSALQWSIYQANLDPTLGSEQAGIRPVLIVSRETINQVLPIVSVLPITTRKPGRVVYPTEVLLPQGTAGLTADSIVMAHQIRTVARLRLGRLYGVLQDKMLQSQIRHVVKLFLDLE